MNEYIIIEHGSVLLSWVSHIALGTQLSGRCLIIGNILIIGQSEQEEAGYFKLEFHELSMELPVWNKTGYYCLASSIRKIGTEQSLTIDSIKHLLIQKPPMEPGNINGPGKFRLGRYKITVDENSAIAWQTIGEMEKTIGGRCIIESGILFIVPKETELDEGQRRQKFFAGLKLLPQWNTIAWGHYGYLMICGEPERHQRSYASVWTPEEQIASITNEIPFPQSQEHPREWFYEYTASGTEWLITTWHRIVEWDAWKRLAPLFITGVMTAFRFSVFLTGKCASISIRVIKRFRSYYK